MFHEKNSIIKSNQQIYDFYKWVIFEKKRHCGKVNFDINELFIQCDTDCCFDHIPGGGVNIYLYGCARLLAPEWALSVFIYVGVYVFDVITHSAKEASQQKERILGAEIGGNGAGGMGWTEIEYRGRQYKWGRRGGLHKVGVRNPLSMMNVFPIVWKINFLFETLVS